MAQPTGTSRVINKTEVDVNKINHPTEQLAPEMGIPYNLDDKVQFKVEYDDKVWPKTGDKTRRRYLKEGDIITVHRLHAEDLIAAGAGKIV